MTIKTYFPTALALEEAPLASVAGAVLKHLMGSGRSGTHPFDIKCAIGEIAAVYDSDDVAWRIASEAIAWLVARCFVCQSPHREIGWLVLTRDGLNAAHVRDFTAWTAERDLPESLLHPDIAAESLASFKVGKFDTAVFEAFKALEVKIRESSKLGHEFIGTKLASRAFNPEDGPLTDRGAEAGERNALMNLMTGALGYFKNPQSHRKVDLEAFEAREMLVFASYLYRIAEVRKVI